jgi:hypothetical protein
LENQFEVRKRKASAFVSELTTNITRSEKLLLLILATRSSGGGGYEATVPLLAKLMMAQERRVYQLLASLEKKGHISRISGKGRGHMTLYRITGQDSSEDEKEQSENEKSEIVRQLSVILSQNSVILSRLSEILSQERVQSSSPLREKREEREEREERKEAKERRERRERREKREITTAIAISPRAGEAFSSQNPSPTQNSSPAEKVSIQNSPPDGEVSYPNPSPAGKEGTSSPDSPPPAGEASPKPVPYLPPLCSFKSFIDIYPAPRPQYRDRQHRADAYRVWVSRVRSQEEANAVCAALVEFINSPEWLKEDGKYIPAPAKFLDREMWRTPPLPNHTREVEQCHADFISNLNGGKSTHKLTPDRRRMLSKRFDESMVMAAKGTNPIDLMKGAIDTYFSDPRREKNPKAICIEAVFGSTETYEKWVRRWMYGD